MAFSFAQYVGDGVTTQFLIPCPYINSTDIVVKVNGVSVAFTFASSTLVQPTVVPALGTVVEVRRTTNKASLNVVFQDGSVLGKQDLNNDGTQFLYICQEAFDAAANALPLNSSSQWDAGSHNIINVSDPLNAQDAATKHYVDTIMVASGNVPNPGASSGGTGWWLKALTTTTWGWAQIAISDLSARLNDLATAAWAQGDIAYFNGTNLVRLPAGTANAALLTKGAAANPTWSTGLPTVTVKTSGSGTYNTPAGCVRLRVRMVGGAGGGGGNGTASQTAGGAGGDTTFSTFTAGHGAGGTAGTAGAIGAGGAGGAASGSPTVGIVGSNGGAPVASGALTANQAGGWGGASPFGGAGAPTIGGGGNAATNSGSGGAGAGGNTSAFGAGGGAAGAYEEIFISNPVTSYNYGVGAAGTAGTAGTSGSAGGAGGAGLIIIEEFYQ